MGHLHNYTVHVPSALPVTMDLKTPCNYMYKYM